VYMCVLGVVCVYVCGVYVSCVRCVYVCICVLGVVCVVCCRMCVAKDIYGKAVWVCWACAKWA